MYKYVEKYTGLSQKEKTRRRRQGLSNLVYIRYADDFIATCNGTKAQAETIKDELDKFLSEKLRLTLSKEKTKITHLNDGFKFLGFEIKRCLGHNGMKRKILIPREAKAKLRNKIKAVTAPQTHRDSVNSKVLALNRIIGGWCRYYQYTSKANSEFSKMENFIFWRMIHWLGRKFQINAPEIIRRYKRGNALATEHYRLKPADEYPTRYYKKRYKKPNPYTTQSVIVREEIHRDEQWLGTEPRPGIADLRPTVFERDEYICQMCDKPVTADTAELDHIRPVRRFKRPVEANRLENLWTLCLDCHQEKTKSDRRTESRMQ